MRYIIAVANEKGGVAKTTTALSLGAALAESGVGVLLIDLDPQANLTLALGHNPEELQWTIIDVLMGGQEISNIVLKTDVDGMDLAPANAEMQMADQFLGIRDGYEDMLKDSLEKAESYAYVILDCPPAVGPISQSALTAADLHILPTQCEFFSAHAIRTSLNLIRGIREKGNPKLSYRLLLTMVDPQNHVHRSLNDQIRKAFGDAVFETVIELDSHLREYPLYAKPITIYAPDSSGAIQYRLLAQEILDHVRGNTGKPSEEA
jgi:chromosome partitioning protein